MEENIRRSQIISKGDFMVFLRHPISLVLLLVAPGLLISVAMPYIRHGRTEVFQE
jgi:putative tricarboxylic transport membrane protein